MDLVSKINVYIIIIIIIIHQIKTFMRGYNFVAFGLAMRNNNFYPQLAYNSLQVLLPSTAAIFPQRIYVNQHSLHKSSSNIQIK